MRRKKTLRRKFVRDCSAHPISHTTPNLERPGHRDIATAAPVSHEATHAAVHAASCTAMSVRHGDRDADSIHSVTVNTVDLSSSLLKSNHSHSRIMTRMHPPSTLTTPTPSNRSRLPRASTASPGFGGRAGWLGGMEGRVGGDGWGWAKMRVLNWEGGEWRRRKGHEMRKERKKENDVLFVPATMTLGRSKKDADCVADCVAGPS